MILLLSFAFLSGLVTILAPCIWPLLPIILSTSITGKGHQRPLGITLGIMISFGVFTLAISSLVKLFHFDANILRLVAVVVIGLLGVSMIVPQFSALTEQVVSRLTGFFGQKQVKGNDFGAGLLTGLSLGIVWSPCAGPILAAIAALAATGKVSVDVVLVTTAYVIGVGIPLFLFSYLGQSIFTRTKFISQYTGRIQQVFGIIMLLTALAIFTNYDTYLQAQLLQAFPQFNLTNIENNSAVKQQLDILKGTNSQTPLSTNQSDLFNTNYSAPDFVGVTKWLNTDMPLSLQHLKGKVVLVDFWTYTCINCIRTLPHVTAWYDKYKNDGFVVIGVHTPEFAFEHDTNNVAHAIQMFGIHYPVAQDNDYATWNNYNNEYWPAEYLIDAQGNVRRTEFGEGEYDKMEMAIQQLLQEAGKKVSGSLENMPDTTPQQQISPETYLGSGRMQYYYPSGSLGNGTQTFTLSTAIPQNSYSLGGEWTITDENATVGKDAALAYNFYADKVYIILRPGGASNNTVKILLDNKPISTTTAGADVKNGVVTVDSDRLYNIVDLHGKYESHVVQLQFVTPGIQAYTFTFG